MTANRMTGSVDEFFSRSDSTGSYYPLSDVLGSTVALTNSSGVLTTQYAYEPFGSTTVSPTSSTNPFQYTGRENEGNGLYYYRARYYDPAIGRFISQDPMGFGGGINYYSYTLDDPPNFVDPSGLETGNLNQLVPGPNGQVTTNPPLTPNQQAAADANLFFLFDWRNWVPTHGNWCGPNWSGGINPTQYPGGFDGSAPPTDPLDALCEQHDQMYERARCKKDILRADEWLHDNAIMLPPDPRYNQYRFWLLHIAFTHGSPPDFGAF